MEAQVADLQSAQQNIIARLLQVRQELDNSLQPLRTQSADRGEDLRSMGREVTALEAEMSEMDARIARLTEQIAAGGGGQPSDATRLGTAMPPPRGARTPTAQGPTASQQSAATTLYNSAYNDYLRENWELCVQGFEQYMRRYVSSDRSDNAQYWIGMCERERGQLAAAHTAFQSVVRDHPDSDLVPDAMLNDGLILKEEGRERAAAESFRRLIQAYGDSDAAFLACGQLRQLGCSAPVLASNDPLADNPRTVSMSRRLMAPALAMAMVLTLASAAWAIRILGATNPGNQMGAVQSVLDLGNDIAGNDIGNTLRFTLEEDGPVIVTFSAECAVDGTEQQWVSIDILANGNALSPSGGDQDTFCSGDSFAGFNDQWVMASMTIPAELKAGNYDLQVQATPAGGAAGWWIGDLALTVLVQKR